MIWALWTEGGGRPRSLAPFLIAVLNPDALYPKQEGHNDQCRRPCQHHSKCDCLDGSHKRPRGSFPKFLFLSTYRLFPDHSTSRPCKTTLSLLRGLIVAAGIVAHCSHTYQQVLRSSDVTGRGDTYASGERCRVTAALQFAIYWLSGVRIAGWPRLRPTFFACH